MTLVEFLAPLKSNKHADRVLAVLYFCERYEQQPSLTADAVKKRLKNSRAPNAGKVNVPDVLSKSGQFVDTNGLEGKSRLWTLTGSGRDYVRGLMNLPANEPELEHDVGTLVKVIGKVADSDVREYLEEALMCLQVGALRPCVVAVWVGAARTLQNKMITKGSSAVTAVVQKHDPKARRIKSVDDFAYVKEVVQLNAALDLGLIDKNQKKPLNDALDLRNSCGHPSKYKPGAKKVSAFMEDVISIVFA